MYAARAETLDDLLAHQSGVLTIAQALRHPTRGEVRWRLASGRWQRVHPRVLITHSGPVTPAERRWAAVLHCGRDAVLSDETAAVLHGVPTPPSRDVHITVPMITSARRSAGVTIHRTRVLTAADVQPARHPPRTRVERTVVDLARAARSIDEASALLAAAVQQRLTTAERLRSTLLRLGPVAGRSGLLEVLDLIGGGSLSLLELRFLRLVRTHRLPEPTTQRRVVRAGSAYLDASFDDFRVVVELDGRAGHWDVEHLVARHDPRQRATGGRQPGAPVPRLRGARST